MGWLLGTEHWKEKVRRKKEGIGMNNAFVSHNHEVILPHRSIATRIIPFSRVNMHELDGTRYIVLGKGKIVSIPFSRVNMHERCIMARKISVLFVESQSPLVGSICMNYKR